MTQIVHEQSWSLPWHEGHLPLLTVLQINILPSHADDWADIKLELPYSSCLKAAPYGSAALLMPKHGTSKDKALQSIAHYCAAHSAFGWSLKPAYGILDQKPHALLQGPAHPCKRLAGLSWEYIMRCSGPLQASAATLIQAA